MTMLWNPQMNKKMRKKKTFVLWKIMNMAR